MKKILAFAAALAMTAMAFAGCGTNDEGKTSSNSQSNDNTVKTVYNVGISQFAEHPSLDNCREGFIQGLAQEGFVEGDNIKFSYQNSSSNMDLSMTIASQFVDSNMDLVCGIATPAASNLYAVCKEADIPVIFCAVSDPVIAGMVPEMGKAGDGITGTSDLIPVEKQLNLIHTMFPEAKKLGILYSTSEVNDESQIALYKELAGNYGLEIVTEGVADASYIPMTAETLVNEVDVITNITDNLIVENLPTLLEKANAKGVPVFGSEEEQVKNGCVASEGLDYVALGVQTGIMAARVLKGEDVSDIGSEYLDESSSKLTINKAVAEGFGAVITEDLDARAEYTE